METFVQISFILGSIACFCGFISYFIFSQQLIAYTDPEGSFWLCKDGTHPWRTLVELEPPTPKVKKYREYLTETKTSEEEIKFCPCCCEVQSRIPSAKLKDRRRYWSKDFKKTRGMENLL